MIVCGSSTLHVFQTSIDFRITGGFLPEKTGQSPLGQVLDRPFQPRGWPVNLATRAWPF